MKTTIPAPLWILFWTLCLEPLSGAQQSTEQNEEALRERVQRLEATVDVLVEELERREMPDLYRPVGESRHGMGPAASKVYDIQQGVSIGGYGEFAYSDPSDDEARWDARRAILYAGFKYDEHWVVNTEIEIEHGTTDATDEDGEAVGGVSLEFGYVDYLHDEGLGVRGGLVLVPMGLLGELHEPTTFLPVDRSQTETRIIPTTWRENGLGLFGATSGGLSYKAFLISGLDGEGFGADGLRGGRQKGAQARSEELAFVGRLDYRFGPGLSLGGSIYQGDAAQGGPLDLSTTIAELHLSYERGPFRLRALAAQATVADAREWNGGEQGVASRLEGRYIEMGYDVLAELTSDGGQSLTPFLRYEQIDTQASLPAAQMRASGQDESILTVGLAYQPMESIILKLDYQDWEDEADRFGFLIGYVF